jgi:hypothetical protein
MQKTKVKYITEFVIKNKRIMGSNVISLENATDAQKSIIQSNASFLKNFVKSKLSTIEGDGTLRVITACAVGNNAFDISFRLQ